jgi:hypothetical protein
VVINFGFIVSETILEWATPVPFLGEALGAVYTTLYYAGLMIMLDRLQRTGGLDTNLLFSGVMDRGLLKRLLVLIAVYTASSVGFAYELKEIMKSQTFDPLLITCLSFVMLLMGVLLSFTLPLMALSGKTLLETIPLGWNANVKNILSLLVLGIFGGLWGVVAILPIGLGLLVYLPVAQCVYYSVYRDIFDPEPEHN